ncbi:hypothetical protein MSAN_00055800 [Mycena sanguinolenta]|uniref:Type II toxin-antitoxin system HicA family toxin n=1 Tax=Mycena sanguinolenta TaxID=230812 RepID=A0A8H6ZCG2_9AGAR|nr:hypothetical protein MSAN_00055800 [Mycena sanguinolenta]
MKWDHFVQVMRAAGFTHDPSAAGSRVRFGPLNPRDGPSLAVHKPHPDTTLHLRNLRGIVKTLRKKYGGWLD